MPSLFLNNGDKMHSWLEILERMGCVMVLIDVIINFSYYKKAPAFSVRDETIYRYKTIWHQRFRYLTLYYWGIVIVLKIAMFVWGYFTS